MTIYTGGELLKFMNCMKCFINGKSNVQISKCLAVLHYEYIFIIIVFVLFTLRYISYILKKSFSERLT